jgi:hypothetical protein
MTCINAHFAGGIGAALNDAPMFMKDGKRIAVATATIRRVGG